ncbi:nuclear transport factor 2 family protein [Winogradskyella algicola]|uniref:nuclear transport factor 2 family protein n=1 Tax=Winogradskyella algicola TaxID=2575815 RepID=UPI001107FCFE|nr:nuclear transport factor 2 family protein [Winogradskyella algicola]
MKTLITIFFVCLTVVFGFSQTKTNLEDINTTWEKFYTAFETLDYTLMAEIHSEDLVRVSGGKRILDYDTYINNYKAGFERDKAAGQTSTISLRFFERINNDTNASERGIYKLVRNKGTDNEKAYYGQFHVLLKKSKGTWKITMDYDSSEGGTIDEDQYQEAFAIDDFEKFTSN